MNRRMLAKEDETSEEVEVRREDQDKINKFSRLHEREQVLEQELKGKQKDKEDMEDVSSQLEELELLGDDEAEDLKIQYKIGDSFFKLPLADVQGMLTANTQQIDKDVAGLEEQLSTVRDEMQELKIALYARFGRSINLET